MSGSRESLYVSEVLVFGCFYVYRFIYVLVLVRVELQVLLPILRIPNLSRLYIFPGSPG